MSVELLYGLVLVGGKSSRMGSDKALLNYHGQSQLEVGSALLASYCTKVFVSKRADQNLVLPHFVCGIDDVVPGKGPMSGILSAMSFNRQASWLVIACDLPFLNSQTLEVLLRERANNLKATAFKSVHSGDPEPLCAIYEPSSFEELQNAFNHHRFCPRVILKEMAIKLVDLPNRLWLENANSKAEFIKAKEKLNVK